ncbi:MAG: FliH/SctL family protein, partial [Mariprofundaceae bacterium]
MKPKVIAGADIGDVQQWSVPSVQGAQSPRPASAGMVTANQTEKIQQKAYQDGFERGLNEGRTAGRNELQDKIQSLHSIASLLNAPLTTLDDEVVNEVTTLAITIAKHMIRRELAAD